ncbi:branched-chain amino acid ABC transporter permease [Aporhodopirellula aestuarii]|uniref:Branched-chain amino acid ABC transporter permease n=1 Tax=Aporhodopirellula aestuarii TaxID=2950107 RepID=A0ABT0UCN9_9BACT|nr:branched-chain amino acid ABC transporter permease [Aporhodopirellula aestuarii]MCM2374654.1 branched-chain amino acid ABC transporter permease [Aporhodopirellula aestuarii]
MQIWVNGLISGASIALLALAFQAVYLPTRVFFIALAGIYAAVPFVALSLLDATGTWWLTAPVAVMAGLSLSLVAERAIHLPLEKKGAASGAQLIASLGAYIVIVQAVAMIWGNDPKSLRRGLDSVSHLGSVIVTGAQWVSLIGATAAIGAFLIFLRRSDLGLRLRALADNPLQFALYGHNVHRYRLLSFAVAGALASIAALVSAYDLGFDAHTGLHAILLAVVAVIIGGRSTFIGPVVGGLILGLLRSQVVWHMSARWQEAVSFGLLAVVLILFPHGLLGRRQRLEAE